MAGLWRVGCRSQAGHLQHGDRPGGRWLAAALGCNPAAPLGARSRSVRGRQDPVQELNLHAAVALSGSLSGAAGRVHAIG
jgi:hypothetical protein